MLLKSAEAPLAVFPAPVVLLKSARSPFAVLKLPRETPLGLSELAVLPTLLKRAKTPLAVLAIPVVLFNNAPAPMAVFSSAVLARRVLAPTPMQKLPSVRLRIE